MLKQTKHNPSRCKVEADDPTTAAVALGVPYGIVITSARLASEMPDSDRHAYAGCRVTVHTRWAAQDARRLLRDAERIVGELHRLLAPDREQACDSIHLYLSDPAFGEPDAGAAGREIGSRAGIVLRVGTESAGNAVAAAITRHCVQQWFGPAAASARVIVEGLAGLAAARIRLGPSIAEADRWVQAEVAAGRPVSVVSSLGYCRIETKVSRNNTPQDIQSTPSGPAAAAFVAFLLAGSGSSALRTYLQTYDPNRPDLAALNAFQRPLAVLEETWLNGLRPRRECRDALRALLGRLRPLLKPYRRRQWEIAACLALAAACNVAIPLVLKYFLKDFQRFFKPGRPDYADAIFYFHQTALRFVGALACLSSLSALLSLHRAETVNRLNQSVVNSLQLSMFARLQRLSHSFYARAKMGDLMTRLTGDLDTIQSALSQLTNKSLYQIFLLAGGILGLLMSTGLSLLTLLILLIVPLFALAYAGLRTRNKAAGREYRRLTAQTAAAAQECLSAHSLIKAFGLAEPVIAAYGARLRVQERAKLRLARLGALTDLSEDMATALAQLLILGVGGYLALMHPKGGIHIEDMVAALLLVKYILGPVASLSGIGQTLQQASGAMERVNELFEEPIAIDEKPDAPKLPPLSREIRLEKVTFGYDKRQEVLQEISLCIEAGAHVAIVGPSGCGKTTTLHLLMRFWDPFSGRVLFDGQDIRDMSVTSLRSQIGLVSQETFVFDTTVRENIALGRPQATDAQIIAAARAARLDEDIQAMPAGYDTVLGERGVRMSGGQRQRLAIARAILPEPKILILDEATSELDAQTEAGILETVSALRQGRTVISVTHHLSWAKDADLVFVLAGGRLVEQGAHNELVKAGGLYQQLYTEQTGKAPCPIYSER